MQGIVWNNPCPAVVDHPARSARGTKSSAFATEWGQVLVAAPFALGADETVLESSAAKVRVKLLAHESR